eukprot:gb/GFBE01012522.1/.p1 GENE.gb/GFBE01012522.1/~~gb/GFBE01012522.1/.p1  ORF type:complete len:490 (+),score=132.88 gb/GFBE01012522.1/:1-1470(+)
MALSSIASKCSLVRGVVASQRLAQGTSLFPAIGATRTMKIASARAVNDGKQVDIEFVDNTAYRFHTAWIKDAHPNLTGSDYYRKSAKTLFEVDRFTAERVEPCEDGSKLQVHFKNCSVENDVTEQYVSSWLKAFAPYVGRPLNEASKASAKPTGLPGTGSLLDDLYKNRKPWGSELKMPTFDGEAMIKDEDMQIEFLERMMDPGCALITNIGKPPGFGHTEAGIPMEEFVGKIIGRLNQHPVRATRFGVIHTQAKGELAGADYDHANPLSMHTDHSVYHGTPGYLQFMYQAQGSVFSKVCDGLAVANYMKEHHPEDYELLTTVQLTHSSRNCIYAKNGAYRRDASDADGASFELVHTHPVLTLDKDGLLEKVVQSETKRGISALPFDVYDRYMEAYKKWTNLVEQDQFKCKFDWPEHSVIVMNNWRVLHGRATVPPNTQRVMVFGYVMKTIYENRHRLLKQRQAERKNPDINDKWLTRLPNQVLTSLVH